MNISLRWLSELTQIPFSPVDLAHRLTMLGVEVEGIADFGSKFERVLVGEVLEVVPHPNANKLRLTKVTTGAEPLSIVCGAPNVRQGMRVAVATIGADLGGGFIIKKSKIRGEVSEGMLCSERELGLSDVHEGIMDLPQHYAVGARLAEAMGKDDVIFEIGITPNRADCLSHIGIAREVAALTGGAVMRPTIGVIEQNGPELSMLASVEILDPDLCPRYAARMVRNVTVAPSPQWLRQRLESVGLRSINNVVDVTNLILMECGHPLHAFDYNTIGAGTVVVRRAGGFAHEMVTLDGKKRSLHPETLLITDGIKPLGVAGIMGGENSEIGEGTRDVFIESAYFDPSSIRRSAKRLGISSDASYRFERGADIENVPYALERAAALIAELAQGELVPGVLDVYPGKRAPKVFTFRPSRANRLLGSNFALADMRGVLDRLAIGVKELEPDQWQITSPSYRVDLEREEDITEEIARVLGYDALPTSLSEPTALPQSRKSVSERDVIAKIREPLISFGFSECISVPLVSEKEAALIPVDAVTLVNPLNVEMSRMRPSLVVNLLDVARRNERFGASAQRIFEIGNAFRYDAAGAIVGQVREDWQLAVLISGESLPKNVYNSAPEATDIFTLKGIVETLLRRVGLSEAGVIPVAESRLPEAALMEEGSVMELRVGKAMLGVAGQTLKSLQDAYDLRMRPYIAVLDLRLLRNELISRFEEESKVRPLPKYPGVERDLALVLPVEVTAARLLEEARKKATSLLLEDLRIFDEYRSAEMKAAGRRSLAVRFIFRAADRTLEEQEIDREIAGVLEHLQQSLGAQLRT